MPWRMRKSIKLMPGVRLNFSKKGASVSAGIPGSGVYWHSRKSCDGGGGSGGVGGCCGLVVLGVAGFLVLVLGAGLFSSMMRTTEPDKASPTKLATTSLANSTSTPLAIAPSNSLALLPEVRRFFLVHSELGTPESVTDLPDWAYGERQSVGLTNGRRLLVYTRSGSVVTVYEDTRERGRVKVWGEYATASPPKSGSTLPTAASAAPDPAESRPFTGPSMADVDAAAKSSPSDVGVDPDPDAVAKARAEDFRENIRKTVERRKQLRNQRRRP